MMIKSRYNISAPKMANFVAVFSSYARSLIYFDVLNVISRDNAKDQNQEIRNHQFHNGALPKNKLTSDAETRPIAAIIAIEPILVKLILVT